MVCIGCLVQRNVHLSLVSWLSLFLGNFTYQSKRIEFSSSPDFIGTKDLAAVKLLDEKRSSIRSDTFIVPAHCLALDFAEYKESGSFTIFSMFYNESFFTFMQNDSSYIGATVGRVANRIGGAQFTLDGIHYKLVANEGKNMLHGTILLLSSIFSLKNDKIGKEIIS